MKKIFPDIEALNDFVAEKFVEIAAEAVAERDRFCVSLAGGSTPKSLYGLLARDKFRDRIDWSKVYFFFGDERNVKPDAPESNYRMAREALFEPLAIKGRNIFRWDTNQPPEICAASYERVVRDALRLEENELPRFDLMLLGMGADGHTASLFPMTKALHETENFAVANRVDKLETTRLTMTFPVINNARNVVFLVAGEDKAETLHKVLEGEFQPERLPSQFVKPHNGKLLWLVDEKAASLLGRN